MLKEKEQRRLAELATNINNRKEHEYAPKTYKDVPDLKEMTLILENNPAESKEELEFAYAVYNYLANAYTSMARFSISANFNLKALETAKKLHDLGFEAEDLDQVFSDLLRDRNFFIDDDCQDVLDLANSFMNQESVKKMYEYRMKMRRTLKHDPVEMSQEYLAVIDEIEEKIDNMKTTSGMGSCFEIWNLKQQLLAEKNIFWKDPHQLNPRVMFD